KEVAIEWIARDLGLAAELCYHYDPGARPVITLKEQQSAGTTVGSTPGLEGGDAKEGSGRASVAPTDTEGEEERDQLVNDWEGRSVRSPSAKSSSFSFSPEEVEPLPPPLDMDLLMGDKRDKETGALKTGLRRLWISSVGGMSTRSDTTTTTTTTAGATAAGDDGASSFSTYVSAKYTPYKSLLSSTPIIMSKRALALRRKWVDAETYYPDAEEKLGRLFRGAPGLPGQGEPSTAGGGGGGGGAGSERDYWDDSFDSSSSFSQSQSQSYSQSMSQSTSFSFSQSLSMSQSSNVAGSWKRGKGQKRVDAHKRSQAQLDEFLSRVMGLSANISARGSARGSATRARSQPATSRASRTPSGGGQGMQRSMSASSTLVQQQRRREYGLMRDDRDTGQSQAESQAGGYTSFSQETVDWQGTQDSTMDYEFNFSFNDQGTSEGVGSSSMDASGRSGGELSFSQQSAPDVLMDGGVGHESQSESQGYGSGFSGSQPVLGRFGAGGAKLGVAAGAKKGKKRKKGF
ncbi:hypothetical protein HK102_004353, partial [Quaeritorhiza haematococci]